MVTGRNTRWNVALEYNFHFIPVVALNAVVNFLYFKRRLNTYLTTRIFMIPNILVSFLP